MTADSKGFRYLINVQPVIAEWLHFNRSRRYVNQEHLTSALAECGFEGIPEIRKSERDDSDDVATAASDDVRHEAPTEIDGAEVECASGCEREMPRRSRAAARQPEGQSEDVECRYSRHVVGQSCVGSDRVVPRVAAGHRAERADDREDGFASTRRRSHEEDLQLPRLGVPRDDREISDRPHRHELLDVIENPDERLGQELVILRAALPRESDGELEHDDGRRALSGPSLEAADRALVHTRQPREPLLGEAQKLAQCTRLPAEIMEPRAPVDVLLPRACAGGWGDRGRLFHRPRSLLRRPVRGVPEARLHSAHLSFFLRRV